MPEDNGKFIIRIKRKVEYEQFTCRIEKELIKKLRRISIESKKNSLNKLINDCIRFALDNLKISNWFKYKDNFWRLSLFILLNIESKEE